MNKLSKAESRIATLGWLLGLISISVQFVSEGFWMRNLPKAPIPSADRIYPYKIKLIDFYMTKSEYVMATSLKWAGVIGGLMFASMAVRALLRERANKSFKADK